MSVGSSPTREICSNCNEPFRVAEQTKPDGKGGWRHPGKCGAEWDGFKVTRAQLMGATPEELAEVAELEVGGDNGDGAVVADSAILGDAEEQS